MQVQTDELQITKRTIYGWQPELDEVVESTKKYNTPPSTLPNCMVWNS
jgi:hypothetical protein